MSGSWRGWGGWSVRAMRIITTGSVDSAQFLPFTPICKSRIVAAYRVAQSLHTNVLMVKYPAIVNVRFADDDMTHLTALSRQLDTPCSTLVRRAWREWVKSLLEKTAS